MTVRTAILRRRGLNLAEVVGIFAMLGVLFGSFVPHLIRVHDAKRLAKLRFNLQKLRQRVDDYRSKFGRPPERLRDAFAEAPVEPIPDNPFCCLSPGERNRVKILDEEPPAENMISPASLGGWLYHPPTGGVWVDNQAHFAE